MTDRIDEIRERLTSATPGPWRIDENDPTSFDSIVSTANDEPWGWVEVARSLGPDSDLIASAPADIAFLLAEVERLTAANDRLARIASQVAVTLEEGKRDLMAHAWDRGAGDMAEWINCGADAAPINPYKVTADD